MSEEGLQVGQVLGYSYRIIASGTPLDIGTAYQAFDMKQGKVVSLLLVAGFEIDSEVLARLGRSKRAVAALAKEALIPFEHVGLAEGRLYLVRGHAEGHSLTNHLARFRTLQSAKAADIAFHIADALAPVHDDFDIFFPLKGPTQFLLEMNIGFLDYDRHAHMLFFWRISCFADS